MTSVVNCFSNTHIWLKLMYVANSHSCKRMMRPSRFACDYSSINSGYEFPPAKVPKTADGWSAHQYFEKHFCSSGDSHEWLERLVNGQVKLLGGTAVAPDTIVRSGDGLVYTRKPWQEPGAPNFFDILFEDDQVLAVYKPPGLQVVPKADFCQHTLMWLLEQYQQQHRSTMYPDSLLPAPVHRLGRGTSGVLLCACTEASRKQLSKDFAAATEMGAAAATAGPPAQAPGGDDPGSTAQQRPMGKQYRALLSGLLDPDEGEVCVPIGLVQYPGLSSGLFAATASGKPALSRFKVLARHKDSTLAEVTILTGRPHQIRIHMAALGHPLVGDPLYGPGGVPKVSTVTGGSKGAYADADCVMPGDCGYHLHSMQLQFRHPSTGSVVTIQAPIPDALKTPQELQQPDDLLV